MLKGGSRDRGSRGVVVVSGGGLEDAGSDGGGRVEGGVGMGVGGLEVSGEGRGEAI